MKTLITFCLLKQIKHFLLLLISITLVFSYASAEIKYKLLETTISELSLNKSQMYHLDMNGDGIDEYFFNHGNQMGDLVCEIYSEPTSFTNEILVDNNIPAMLDYSSEISGNSTEWLNTYNGVGSDALYFLGNWPGAFNKFVAVRFKIDGSYHYGWISVEIPADSTSIKIKDCAYDDVAGQMIYAGYKGVEDVQNEIFKIYSIVVKANKIIFNDDIGDYQNLKISIYDRIGNFVKSSILNNSTSVLEFEELNAGLYFIVVSANSKILQRAMIIK